MPRKLSEDEMTEVRRWLAEHQINPNKIHREFSDGVAVANLLKKFYPKIIDLHNYPPRNNTQLKIINWETLHNKALIRLGINLSKRMYEQLAKGAPGAIESLLYSIMLIDRAKQAKDEKEDNSQEKVWTENDDILTVPVTKKVGDALIQVPQKMILYSIYEQQVRESNNKDELIEAAEKKVAHLEDLVLLKTNRIDELCAHLAKISPNDPKIAN